LLLAWRGGDLRSGQRLWRRHSDSVRRFFRNKVPWAVALDLTQRTVEACLRAQDRIRSFRSYVLGVATRQLFDYLRSERRQKLHDVDLETLIIEDTVTSAEDWVGAKREKRVLLRALRRLPLPLQLVLELRYWEQLSDRDIADVLAWPQGTVKTRISTGKRALRAQIKLLTQTPEQLLSTIDTFEQWAARTRKLVSGASAPSDSGDGTPLILVPDEGTSLIDPTPRDQG
jgi:RNA polymerase sigma-70 factor (ECF subfamily)